MQCKLLKRWAALETWQKILFAMASGIVLGLILGDKATYIKPVGTLFINAIKMMIVPVVFTAIVCAILSMNDPQKMRRIGIKTLALYITSMTIATIIGLTVTTYIAPGAGLTLTLNDHVVVGQMPSVMEAVVNIIPSNVFNAFSTANILQLLVFAIFVGVAINLAGPKAALIKDFFIALSAVVFKLTAIVMKFAPYGIFALLATTVGEFGIHALLPLFKLILAGYLSCLLLCVIFYAGTLRFFAKLKPSHFYKGIAHAFLLGFSSSSSTATLPVSVRCAEENLGVSKGIAGFLLPLGTTLNLNGLAIYLSTATVFAANIYGIHLGFAHYLTLLISIVLTSMGAGGIPGSAIIVMGAVMSSIGLPLGAIPLIAGIDRIIDMGMTATNVAGDLFATTMIAKSEKELDEVIYNRPVVSN